MGCLELAYSRPQLCSRIYPRIWSLSTCTGISYIVTDSNHSCPDTAWNLFRLQYLDGEGLDPLLPLPFVAPEYHAYLQFLRGRTFNILGLPAEIRNKIYRYTLTGKIFTVKLQFKPFDTSLMRVNKQIYRETSSLFYYENSFRIPQSLFVGAPILDQLEKFYHLPRQRLSIMKRLLIDIPVHGPRSLSHLKAETKENVDTLAMFLSKNRKWEREIKIELNIVWGEERRRLTLLDYLDLIEPWVDEDVIDDLVEGNIEMSLQVHPIYLDAWVDLLVCTFPLP